MTTQTLDERVMLAMAVISSVPAGQRAIRIREICGGDEELFREISEQLNWQAQMGGFLLKPAVVPAAFDRPFQPGQMLSGRFRIERELGEGGMGIVFEAFDLKRSSRIAVKVAKTGFGRLLTPELSSALKVRHPNICMVNEIHTATADEGEFDFLTMELLEGETLRALVRREGPVPPAVAFEITRQLCAGLSEAHRSGILHRDLKSGNVILARTEEGSLRAVITDFGLSAVLADSAADLAGTPGYLAPELLEGQPASKASDIYALGVLLYEMVTGKMPPSGGPGEAPAHQAKPSAVEGLSSRWDRAILPCLNANPARRPSDAGNIVKALEKRNVLKSVLAAACLVLAAGMIPGIRDPLLRTFHPPPVRVAILPFAAPADASVQIGGTLQDVSDRLRRRQRGGGSVVSMPPTEAVLNDVNSAARAGKVLHATHAVEGKVTREGQDLVVEADVIDISAGARLSHFVERYSPAQAGDIPRALAGAVSLALRLQGAGTQEALSPVASRPYLQGLFFLRRDARSYDEAIPLFVEATHADPHSPLPLTGLSEALLQKYSATKEQEWLVQAQEAYQSSERLDPDSVRVRLTGGMLNEALGRYEKALQDYERVIEIDPKNAAAMQGEAGAYDSLDLPDKAIAAYQAAIRAEPDYYAPYQALGVHYYYRGKYREAAEQFQRAVERAPGLVKAYTNLAAAWGDLGRDAEAEQALLASLQIRVTAGALNSMGAIRSYQTRNEEATGYYERARELDPRNYIILLNLGDSYRRAGHLSDATRTYRDALQIVSKALEDNPRRGFTRVFVGYLAARLGERGRAESEIGQALQLSPSDQQVIRLAVLTWEVLGDREAALRVARTATPEMLNELARQPDLKELRSDARFVELQHLNHAPEVR